MTPLEKLTSLPQASRFLREGITLDHLPEQARSQTDVEAARQVRKAGENLLGNAVSEPLPLYSDIGSFAQACAA